MKLSTEVVKREHSAVELTVTIAQEEVASEYQGLIKDLAQKIAIPGFRKGHVPVSLLERKYGEEIKNDTADSLVRKTVKELFDPEKAEGRAAVPQPVPYRDPELSTPEPFDLENPWTFKLIYDVFPEVKVGDFSGIVIEEPQVKITGQDIDGELKKIQERNALVIDRADNEAAAAGDVVTIDFYEADETGAEIPETRRDDFVITLGESYQYYEFDDRIIGMKKGAVQTIEKTYPPDSPKTELAGKTLRFVVTLKALKRRDLPAIDDELAQDVSEKYKTLADMKADITRRLEMQRDTAVRQMKIEALMNQLVKLNPIDLPHSMIHAQAEAQWEQMTAMFGQVQSQSSNNALEDLKRELFPKIEKSASHKLKQSLIVQTLTSEAKIECTPEDFEAEYAQIAELENVPAERIKENFESGEEKKHLERLISEKKLFDSLLTKTQVKPGKNMGFIEVLEASQQDSSEEEADK
jgi:trigger factor